MFTRFISAVSIIVAALSLASGAVAQDGPVRVVLKFVKREAATGPAAVFDPASCQACVLLQDPAFARNNAHETLIDLRVPYRRTLDLVFNLPEGDVRRVVLETGDIPFTRTSNRLIVHLPPLIDDAVNAGEFHTHIVEPGMVLRFEHDDPVRRAGAYADAPLDFLQRRAADTLTFAQREAIRRLGIGETVEREGLGKILLMGFDTNFPHGHTDAPAHMHMHMRWPDNAGTQISHFYIDERGLLVRNEVGIQFLGAAERVFGPEQSFTTIDRRGRPTYTHTITDAGWLELSDRQGRTCVIRPIKTGFQTGAIVHCPDGPDQQVRVEDDLSSGQIRVSTNDIEEVFRYDTDTGVLISAQVPPDTSASGYPPSR